jgi:hypothetical protein
MLVLGDSDIDHFYAKYGKALYHFALSVALQSVPCTGGKSMIQKHGRSSLTIDCLSFCTTFTLQWESKMLHGNNSASWTCNGLSYITPTLNSCLWIA